MKFSVSHAFKNITLVAFEELYFDEEFNIAQCRELRLDRTLVERQLHDGKLVRAVRVGPDREIPAPIAKFLGTNKIEYTEHLAYAWGSLRGTWKSVPAMMADKIDSQGNFWFRQEGDQVVRAVDGDVKVKIFGFGTIAERFICSDVERSYDAAARFTQTWIDKKAAR